MVRSSNLLKVGCDYPRTWNEFLDWFHDEEACINYLEQLRWPQGFICPCCGVRDEPYQVSRGRIMCRTCRHQCTATAGTLFAKTRTPLRTWFAAAWYVTSQKNGVSALGLQRALGLGSYQTAWSMLHRLRRAMVNPAREKLRGVVEVDETYIGGREKGKRSAIHYSKKKAIIVVAVELLRPKGFGRVRLRQISSASKKTVLPFVCEAIEPGSVIHTDGSPIYDSLKEHGYTRNKIVHLGSSEPAHTTMPGVHRVASLLKRWLLGTHQGSVQSDKLDYYLDEYVFRFNRRTSRSRGLLFYRLLEQAVVTDPITYHEIVRQ
jgi:transposase-like protein